MTDSTECLIHFFGKVQGVGFRYTTYQLMNETGLTGYVENLPNGSVELLLQGSKQQIEFSLDLLKAKMMGYVQEIEISWKMPKKQFKSFQITG